MYNPNSTKAEEFISHQEILDTIEYAEKNKDNKILLNEILEKAKFKKGLTHREASVLLACNNDEINNEIFTLAKQIKEDFYGNRIVLFAPLYLSNYCINGCTYCPYHAKNTHIPRKKMTQEEIRNEVIALQDMGHKRLAIESGEDPINNPIEYILESINTIYSIKHKNGAIRRVNVNIAATTVENYRKLHEAKIGTYILNLKLNTAVAGSDSELGLYADAVKINVISKPLSLNYEPNEDLLEESTTNETEYISKEPKLEGSLEGVNYSIASISPSTDKITIDPTTGKIVVAKGHGFSNGESYTVSVLVKNQFCEEGVVFEDVFKLNIVEFIEPIANFSYPETTVKQALKIDVQKNPGFQGGGNLTFAFSEEDKTKYDGILTLDEKTGEISAPKYNTLEIGNYEVHVIATNNKTPEGVEAVLRLNINENENYFTTINYGNNLGEGGIELDGEIYNNQFRFTGTSGANGKTFSPKSLDLKGSGQTVKWSISLPRDLAGTTIDQSTGTITLAGTSNKQIRFALITAKVGNNEEEAIERTVPFFVSIYDKNNQANVLYTPFVFHVNPEIGGTSVPPVVNKESVAKMDFRRDFFYINIDGVDTDGIDLISNTVKLGDSNHDNFLGAIWDKYYEKAGKSEYGSKGPVSYYLNEGKLNSAMAYIDNVNDFSIVVPPNRWYADGWADGVFFGQIVFGDADDTIDYIDGSDNPNKVNPVVIWFDKDYNPEKN